MKLYTNGEIILKNHTSDEFITNKIMLKNHTTQMKLNITGKYK